MRTYCRNGHLVNVRVERAKPDPLCPHCGSPLVPLARTPKRSVEAIPSGLPSLGKRRP